MTRRAIDGRLARGSLHPLYRGVYLVGTPEPPPLALEHGAVLACWPHALISHRSAAELWQLVRAAGGDVDVTVVGRAPGRRPGMRLHRVAALHGRDYRSIERIP